MNARIPLSEPVLGEAEQRGVAAAVAGGFVSSAGPLITEFETRFAASVGSRYAVACASGTAALHLALVVCGVGRDDLVAVSDFTFMASANAASYQGADLLLIDSDRDSWCMDPRLVRAEFARRRDHGERLPAVLEIVHILGQPADPELFDICAEFGVTVVEDAAEALGATWTEGRLAGRQVGTAGLLGAFSFNGNKIITTGGGGMVTTDDADLAERVRHLSTQARVPAVGYLHDAIGYNYRLTNVAAALGLAQLDRLQEHIERKRHIARRYDESLAPFGFGLPPRPPGTASTFWLYSALLPDGGDRDALLDHLNRDGVDARALWRPLHDQPPMASVPRLGSGAVSEELFARGVSLPSSASLTDADQDRVLASIVAWSEQR
jgi:dTDP-4-amino-4,6-dideoxygalactose transaminase